MFGHLDGNIEDVGGLPGSLPIAPQLSLLHRAHTEPKPEAPLWFPLGFEEWRMWKIKLISPGVLHPVQRAVKEFEDGLIVCQELGKAIKGDDGAGALALVKRVTVEEGVEVCSCPNLRRIR